MENLRELVLQAIKDAPLDGDIKKALGDIKEDEVYGALTAISMRIFGLSKVQSLATLLAVEKVCEDMPQEGDVIMLAITKMTQKFLEEKEKNTVLLN